MLFGIFDVFQLVEAIKKTKEHDAVESTVDAVSSIAERWPKANWFVLIFDMLRETSQQGNLAMLEAAYTILSNYCKFSLQSLQNG